MIKQLAKILRILVVLLFLIQLVPFSAFAETTQTVKESSTTNTIPKRSADILNTDATTNSSSASSDESSEDNNVEEKENSGETTKSKEKETESSKTEQSTEKTQESSEKKEKETKRRETRAASRDLSKTSSATFKITNWNILDASGKALSATNKAKPNVAYDFDFTWQLKFNGADRLQNGDYIKIPVLENEEWGEWQLAGTAQDQLITVQVDGKDTVIGKWEIKIDEEDEIKKIGIYFTEEAEKHLMTSLTAVKFSVPSKSLMNYTVKAGVQNVVFGDVKKQIGFEATTLSGSRGFDFKRLVNSGNGSMQYSMTVNFPETLELGGDEVNWSANPSMGFYQDPVNPKHYWGEYATDVNDIYVEDVLDPGVTVSTMLIAGMVRTPMDFPASAETTKKGGRPSSDIAYDAYVLVHSKQGPVYRTGSGTESDKKRPTEANSFTMLTQKSGETKAAFSARVKSKAYQYGIFVDGKGATATRTVMAYFGKIGAAGGTQKKYSDLTMGNDGNATRWAIPTRYTKNKSGANIQIPQFAALAAEANIKKGFYAESQRDLLESYYTLTYGNSNVLKGQIATYDIELILDYPPESTTGKKTNTVDYYHKHKLDADKTLPRQNSAEGEMTNPYAEIKLNPNSAMLFKWDDDDLSSPLNGFTFKLQKKNGSSWTDVKTNLETASNTVSGNTYDGTIKVDNLANGTYRFFETKAKDGYSQELSSSWNASAGAVTSEEFEISASKDGAVVHVRNKKKPVSRYQVQHYLQKVEGQAGSASDFEMKMDETLYGETGATVTATPRTFDGYRHDSALSFNVKSGVVKEDGTLVLKLYYVIDTSEIKFQIYKTDTNKKPMPSISEAGDPLYNELNKRMQVKFRLYKFTWIQTPEGGSTHPKDFPPTAENIAAGYWTYLEDLTTDAKGRILAKGLDIAGHTFGLVETVTYPNFILPTIEEAYWAIYGKDGEIGSISSYGTNNPGAVKDYQASDGKTYYRITNKARANFVVYKSNELNELMPSTANAQVKFKLYEFVGTTGSAEDKGDFSNTTRWKPVNKVGGDNEHRITALGRINLANVLVGGRTYALQETETYPDYQYEDDAYWIVNTKVKDNQEGAEISDIIYSKGKNGSGNPFPVTSPGVIKPNDSNNPIPGSWHLKNLPKKMDIEFIKENEKKEPLSDVEFKLYGGKAGEELKIGTNDDPNAAKTYWDMGTVLQTKTSATTTGIVGFTGLKAGNYLLVETKTVEGYTLPKGQWIITVDTANNKWTVEGRGTPKPPAFYTESGKQRLPNERMTGDFIVYKSNELNEVMPSDSKKQVAFKFYEFVGTTGNPEDKGDFTNTNRWKAVEHTSGNNTYKTDTEGRIINIPGGLVLGKTYAMQEISTYPDYDYETDAYWVLTTGLTTNKQAVRIAEIVYTKGKDGGGTPIPVTSPGTLRPFAADNPTQGYWHVKNLPRIDIEFIKENEKKEPLSDVEFKLYGGKAGEELKIGTNDDPNAAKTYWDMGTVLQTKTSATTTGIVGFTGLKAGNYLLVETKTVEGYTLPKGQWIITVDTANNKWTVKGRGTPKPPEFYTESGKQRLPNERMTGDFIVYKSNELNEVMPSDSKKQVAFKFYEFVGTTGNPEDKGDFTNTNRWKAVEHTSGNNTYKTDTEGRIINIPGGLVLGKTYAMQEISTYPDYDYEADAYWVLTTGLTTDKKAVRIAEIIYTKGKDGGGTPIPVTSPGTLKPFAADNPTQGYWHVKNLPIKLDIEFIKENEKKEPLSDVEFKLYGGKAGEELKIGTNDDPNAAKTYWDMGTVLQTKTSATTTGIVGFTGLKAGNYLLVEAKTVEGYTLPKGQWIITVDTANNKWTVEGRGTPKPPAFYTESGKQRLPNERMTGDFIVYKSNELNEIMPSDSKKQVAFKFYEFVGTTGNPEDKGDFTNTNRWKAVEHTSGNNTYKTDTEGRIINIPGGLVLGKTYAMQEISTYPDYDYETDAYWVLTTGLTTNKQAVRIAEIVYTKGKDGGGTPIPVTSPGTLRPFAADNPTQGYWHVKNLPIKLDIEFIKENEKKEPLSGVEFKLYGGKAGEELKIGTNDNPNVANTYWDMGTVLQTKTSATTTGTVEFAALKTGNYLLVETKTVDGYLVPTGQWILTVDSINNKWTVQGRGDPLPPAFYSEGGKQRLPNYKKLLGFFFTKVNQNKEPLGGVEFKLYGGKAGETLQIGTNDDPQDPSTYWDMTTVIETQTSHSTTGNVSFNGLATGNYLLMETKTVDGYELPSGQWIITVDANLGTVSDPMARGNPLPPAFYKDSGELFLPNYRKLVMPKAGGIGLHVVASVGILLIGLAVLLLLERYKKHI